jgi:predicted nucleic acid-binding protein
MIYVSAKILGLIDRVAPKLDQLRHAAFRLSDEHYRLILKEVGEL